MANEVGKGVVPIEPNVDGFGAALEQGIKREGEPAAKEGARQLQMAMAGVFTAGAALLGKSVFDAAGFERQMNEVFTLLPGITGEAMGEMTGDVKAFATEFGILPQEVVPALYSSLSAGVPAGNVFEFMETATKLAKGGVTDLETAVDGLTSVVNAYGADVLPAQQASDLLFTTVKLGKTTVAELSSAIFQVTPTAAALGVEFGNVTAALAAMTLQGVPTSVATTQLRQLFVELSKSGSGTAKVFEELAGKTFKQFIADGGDLQGALQMLEYHAGATGIGINDLFGSVEAGSAALALTGGGTEAFSNALAGMEESAGATDAAFDTMNQGLAATLDKLKAKFAVSLIEIGTAIAPTVQTIGMALGGLLEVFSALPGPMQAIALIFVTLSAGAFAFSRQIVATVQLLKGLSGVMTALAANPWVLGLMALVVIAMAVITHWEEVKKFFEGVVMFFKALFSGFTEDEGTRFEMWALRIRDIFGTIRDAVVEIFGIIRDAIVGTWNDVAGATVGAWDQIYGTVTGVISTITGLITAIPTTVTNAFTTLANIIAGPFISAFAAIKAAWNSTVGGFGFTAPSWIPGFGGNGFTIPRMAQGGVLTGPSLFMGGEYPGAASNPEIVTPQNIMRETVVDAITSVGAPISISLTMHVDAGVTDPRFFEDRATDIVRVVQRELDRDRRASGRATTGVAA